MARFLVIATILATANAKGAAKYGHAMSSRSYDAVCWYENLKVFPETHSDAFLKCNGVADQVRDQVENPSAGNKAYIAADTKGAAFGEFMNMLHAMDKLPKEYKTGCSKYLDDIDAAPPADESDALNDSGNYDYPYKAFAYCLMKTLRTKHGDEAIEAVKNERTHKLKNWMQTLLDRENEFRARHGSPPLKLNRELVNAAQEWADINAKKCDSYHSDDSTPNTKFQGKQTGESLSAAGGKEDKQLAAYMAADGWYEENKDYKYEEYNGDGTDSYFMSIGHFTQSVWKETKYVGYGFAYNGECDQQMGQFKNYIVARYYPAGNMPGKYMENVSRPK